MAQLSSDRLSLVVGVTGHRDIAADDEAPLRAAFGRVLERLAARCPHTPLLVLSGLAAGADTIAADEAIARGIPVLACLPMPVDEYEKDFSPAELARFRALLGQAARVVVTSRTRENGYVATGRFIAQYSHLLVAFWDEQTSRGAGGTGDVVQMRMTLQARSDDIEEIPYLPDVGPVEIISTPRMSAPRPPNAFSAKRLYPKPFVRDQDVPATFASILAHIDAYNVDLASAPVPATAIGLPALMERTDAVANRLQRVTRAYQLALYAFAFAAAAAQVLTHVPLPVKVVFLGLAFLAYTIARAHDYENRYQDYRAVAEGLRVQEAWYCAGLGNRLVDNEYLRMQEGELQWIRMALRYFYLLFCEDRENADASQDHPACRDWVQSQRVYYFRAYARAVAARTALDRVALAAIWIGVASLVLSGLAMLFGPASFTSANATLLQDLLTVPIILAAMLAAIFSHHAEKENLVGNARRYRRMFYVFQRGRRALVALRHGKPGDASEVYYELGRAALAEHADWLIMRRDRPMKVVLV